MRSSSAPTRSSTDSPEPEATASRQRIAIMDLSRGGIVEGLQRIVEPGDVITDEKILVASSVDNFRKLQNIFDVHTMPVPAAIVMARSTEQVAAILRFAGEHGDQRHPAHGRHGHRGRPRERRARLDHHRRLRHDRDRQHRRLQHAGHLPVRRAAAGARGPRARAGPHHGAFPPVEARRPHGRPRRDPQHRSVLDTVRRHRGHGRGARGRLSQRCRDAHQERPPPGGGARHPPRRHRQRGRAVLHHRGHGQALPVLSREQHLSGLHAEGHEDRLRGPARQ